MSTKEELEIERLEKDVQFWKQSFWIKPAYLAILAPLTLGFMGYIATANDQSQQKIEELQSKKEVLQQEYRLLELTRIPKDTYNYEIEDAH